MGEGTDQKLIRTVYREREETLAGREHRRSPVSARQPELRNGMGPSHGTAQVSPR